MRHAPDTLPPSVLAPGYDWADLNLTRSEARWWFLQIAHLFEPAMLESLGAEAYPLYRAIPPDLVPLWGPEIHHTLVTLVIFRQESGVVSIDEPRYRHAAAWLRARAAELPIRLPEHAVPLYRWMPFVEPGVPWPPDVMRLHERVHAWAERWQIAEEWCIDQALWTLSSWRRQEELRTERQLPLCQPHEWGREVGWDINTPQCFTFRSSPIDQDVQYFSFGHEGWEPIKTTRAEAEQVLRAAFEARLADYLDEMEGLATARGLVPVPQKRGTEHFEWLVRYQIQGRSFQAIARDACRDRKTVTGAVRETAALLQLSLRPPGQPGRPSKFPMSRPVAACRK